MNRTIKEYQKVPHYQCKFTMHRVVKGKVPCTGCMVKVFAPREKRHPCWAQFRGAEEIVFNGPRRREKQIWILNIPLPAQQLQLVLYLDPFEVLYRSLNNVEYRQDLFDQRILSQKERMTLPILKFIRLITLCNTLLMYTFSTYP